MELHVYRAGRVRVHIEGAGSVVRYGLDECVVENTPVGGGPERSPTRCCSDAQPPPTVVDDTVLQCVRVGGRTTAIRRVVDTLTRRVNNTVPECEPSLSSRLDAVGVCGGKYEALERLEGVVSDHSSVLHKDALGLVPAVLTARRCTICDTVGRATDECGCQDQARGCVTIRPSNRLEDNGLVPLDHVGVSREGCDSRLGLCEGGIVSTPTSVDGLRDLQAVDRLRDGPQISGERAGVDVSVSDPIGTQDIRSGGFCSRTYTNSVITCYVHHSACGGVVDHLIACGGLYDVCSEGPGLAEGLDGYGPGVLGSTDVTGACEAGGRCECRPTQ